MGAGKLREIEIVAAGVEDAVAVGHPGGVVGEDVADAEGRAADGGNDPERLLGLGREMVAQQETGAVGRDVAEGRRGHLGRNIDWSDGSARESNGTDAVVSAVDDAGEEMDAVGRGCGEVSSSSRCSRCRRSTSSWRPDRRAQRLT
jgi:hypothetical protein